MSNSHNSPYSRPPPGQQQQHQQQQQQQQPGVYHHPTPYPPAMSPEQAYGGGGGGYNTSPDTMYRSNPNGLHASPNLPGIQDLDPRPHVAVPPPQTTLPNMTMGMVMPHHMAPYYMTAPGHQYMTAPQVMPRYAGLAHSGRNYLGTPKKEIKRRTKTGCMTCRKRRIKCDETHPTCNNCKKSKRECAGYDPIFKQQQQQGQQRQQQGGQARSTQLQRQQERHRQQQQQQQQHQQQQQQQQQQSHQQQAQALTLGQLPTQPHQITSHTNTTQPTQHLPQQLSQQQLSQQQPLPQPTHQAPSLAQTTQPHQYPLHNPLPMLPQLSPPASMARHDSGSTMTQHSNSTPILAARTLQHSSSSSPNAVADLDRTPPVPVSAAQPHGTGIGGIMSPFGTTVAQGVQRYVTGGPASAGMLPSPYISTAGVDPSLTTHLPSTASSSTHHPPPSSHPQSQSQSEHVVKVEVEDEGGYGNGVAGHAPPGMAPSQLGGAADPPGGVDGLPDLGNGGHGHPGVVGGMHFRGGVLPT